MTQRSPIWTAQRLNEELSRAEGTSVAFTPFGDVVQFDTFDKKSLVHIGFGTWRVVDDPTSVAEVVGLKVAGIETVMSNLTLMPAGLALAALDPEAWCVIVIHANAREIVGPFRETASPLREWLLHAVLSGHSVGMNRISAVARLFLTPRPGAQPLGPEPIPLVIRDESGLPPFPLPDLVPEGQSLSPEWLAKHLATTDVRGLGCDIKSEADAVALAAGLWQMNDFLDRSHELSQSIEGQGRNRAGDYWHAIMHRREPDYSNAKYWLRRVGRHGIHPFLARDADDILASCPSDAAPRWRNTLVKKKGQELEWDAFAFVDLCQAVEKEQDPDLSLAAREIQFIEMALLLKSTHHDAGCGAVS